MCSGAGGSRKDGTCCSYRIEKMKIECDEN